MSESLIGEILGQYRVIEQLGAGGMGVVYKAQDVQLGRLVALKVLPEGTADDEEATERFRREARTASSLNHPNICTIYSFDEHRGQLYLAMELLEGAPLESKLANGPIDLGTMLDLATQIADGLDAAHSEGVLHRDIKPANIFLTRRNQVKVLDFGLAKLAPKGNRRHSRGSNPTERFSSMVGTTVGTVAYMSPEQARGEDLDPRTDLFSFGVVLYEMATGQQSFPGATTAVVFDGILNREPTPPSTLNVEIPREIDRIISKALEKDRAFRYQSAADMRADLQRLKRDSGSRRVIAAASEDETSLSGVTLRSAVASALRSASSHVPQVASPPTQVVAPPTQVASPPAVAPTSGSQRRGASPMAVAAVAIVVVGLAVIAGVVFFRSTPSNNATETPQVATAPIEAPPPAPAPLPSSPTVPTPTDSTTPAPVGLAPAVPASPTSAPVSVTPARTSGPTPAKPTIPTSPPASPGTAGAPMKSPTTDAVARAEAAIKAEAAARAEAAAKAETAANERIEIARAKMANNLLEPALADVRQIIADFPGMAAAAEASFMSAEIFEKMGRTDDAMAAHIEFSKRFPTDRRMAASQLRLAELTARSKRPDRDTATRDILSGIIRNYPGTPQSLQALQTKIRIDGDRRQRELDPVLGVQVPAVVPTLRAFTEQFPKSTLAVGIFHRLAEAYIDLNQFERAAQALTDLATNFPNNPHDAWFRAGELYERRLKNLERARQAYANVPAGSSRFRDAQRKLKEGIRD